ncbi:MAG: DUF86 domain-containing protein [Candidatus Magasanikbacteria bacterium]
MTQLEQEFVEGKLSNLSQYIDEIEEFFDKYSNEDILNNFEKKHAAERMLELAVESMININQHFIKSYNLEEQDDFQSTFYTLAENDFLPEDFAEKIAPVVGIRNRIVHGYEKIDHELFIREFRENYQDFEKYKELIEKQID